MWSYYGSKNRIRKLYPKPLNHKVDEPACGAAYYSIEHFENDILLIDKNPMVISIWHYLQQASVNDIKRLPILPPGYRINRDQFDCDGEYNLMRFLIVQAAYGGNNVVSKWGAIRMQANINRVVANLYKCKHWKIIQGDYTDTRKGNDVTRFFDLPYEFGGEKYPFSSKKINYSQAADFIRSLPGQNIVCENTKATWMPFIPIKKIQGVQHQTTEAIWTNYHTHYNNIQQQLFV